MEVRKRSKIGGTNVKEKWREKVMGGEMNSLGGGEEHGAGLENGCLIRNL